MLRSGRLEAMEFLVKCGAKTNTQGAMGNTPLPHVRRLGMTDLEDWLIEHGALELV